MDFLGAEPPVNEPPSRMEGAMMVANPMIKVEIDYIALGLEESKLILNTPRQSLMESWYGATFKKVVTRKNPEVCSVASGGEINYLKKRITCMVGSLSLAPRLLLQPHRSYIPNLQW